MEPEAVVNKRRAKVRILAHLRRYGVCLTQNMARILDLHERSAQRYMQDLLADGLVEVARRGEGGAPHWTLTDKGRQAVTR